MDAKQQMGLHLLASIDCNHSMDKNHMPCKMWNEITCPFANFNGATDVISSQIWYCK